LFLAPQGRRGARRILKTILLKLFCSVENRLIRLTISPKRMTPERPPKVFISYSHDSPEHMKRVLALADRLRADGVNAIIDQYFHDPEDGWQVWTQTQMREADFVLVVCTETYLRRAERREEPGTGHGAIWEISVAYVLLYNQGMKNKKLVPVVFDAQDRDYIPLPLQPYTNYCLADDQGYVELYRRLTNQPSIIMPEMGKITSLPQLERLQSHKIPSTAKPWNIPSRNDAFTGREHILGDLRADLQKKGKQALFGLGGVGKTQIAAEYAYRHREDYTAVLWTFAGTEQSVRGGFGAIAALLDLPEKESTEQGKVIEAVRRWLEQSQGWLLVLDNADDTAMVKAFLPQQIQGHLLLTSRAHAFQTLGILQPREVNVLSPEEARRFLLLRTGKDPAQKSAEADALAKELGYLPLALEQAAAYMVEKSAGLASYLKAYQKQRQSLLNQQGPVLGNDAKEQQKRTVATAWAVNFADIEKKSPASADLLRLSAFLAPDAIPLELLEKGGNESTGLLAAKLAEAAENPLALDELLSPLLRFSLVRRDEEKRTYSIHPLVQDVVRDGLSKKEQKTWAERAVRAMDAVFPDIEFTNWPQCDRLLPHALTCASLIESFGMEFAEGARLLNQAGYYLNERAEYAQAEPLFRRALAIREKALGPEHPHTASSLNNLAELLRFQGKPEEAEPLYRRALAIYEKALGPEHPDTATGLNNLAELLRDQGKLSEAEPLYRRALAIREEALGPEHPSTAASLNNLALLLDAQGKPEEAEPLYRRALAMFEKALGPEHPDTATSMNNLASLLEDQEKPKEAELLYRRALAIREKALGPEHPDTANSLNNLALLLAAQGRLAEAEPLYRRSLAIYEKALGPEHPNTALVRNNLILFYRRQGREAEAEALEKRSP
jgi:tetratricopeptide (TPR) repeat protein